MTTTKQLQWNMSSVFLSYKGSKVAKTQLEHVKSEWNACEYIQIQG